MGELILWKQQEIDKLKRDMDQLFRRFRREFGIPRFLIEAADFFSIKFFETTNTLTVTAELPGIKPDDIEISVTENTMTLKGQTRADTVEDGEVYQRVEKRSQSFSRTIALPCRIMTETVKATFKDNVLQIVLPKCKPTEARGVEIEIG